MLGHNKELYTPQEEALITPYLKRVDRTAHAGVFGQGLIEIWKGTGKLNLQEIEIILRKERCRTYLTGLSMESHPEVASQYESKLPGIDMSFPYWLWTEVNWEPAYRAKLAEEGITYDQNFERLAETGMLVPRRGTMLSQSLSARWN